MLRHRISSEMWQQYIAYLALREAAGEDPGEDSGEGFGDSGKGDQQAVQQYGDHE